MPVTGVVGHSGGVTVGRELSLALARQGHDVFLRVSVPVRDLGELDVANLTVLGLDPVPGIDERGQLLRSDGLPRGIDVVIGHGRFTGGAASYLRDQFYPEAKLVHVVHAMPDDLDRFRGDPLQAVSHAATEQFLIANADVAMGVGPLLTEEAGRLARIAGARTLIAELPPGVTIGEMVPRSGPQRQINMLMFGRIDDPLKGGHIAAGVVKELNAAGHNVRLTMLGANVDSIEDNERQLSQRAESIVKVKPFTSDRATIAGEIRGADLVVMPSLHEGFGLVATEATGYGVPTFVSSETGAGWLFSDTKRIPAAFGRRCVVQAPPGASDHQLVTAWAAHIEPLISPPDRLADTRRAFAALRQHLARHFTWDHSARALEAKVGEAPGRADLLLGTGRPDPQRIRARATQAATPNPWQPRRPGPGPSTGPKPRT